MKYKLLSSLFVATLLVTFFACRPSTTSTEDTSKADAIEKEEIEKSLTDLAYPLPEPFELYMILEDIGASYLNGVLNPVSNAETYMTQKSQALGAGVYAADLGYAATYNSKEDIKAYAFTMKSLLDGLGVALDYSPLMNEESRQKLEDKDSLVAFITNIFYDTYSFLEEESIPSLSGLMASGAWVEGLYIATHISDDTYNNTEIVKIIFEQGESLDELIGLLQNFKEDERVSSLLGAFEKLLALYKDAGDSLTKEQLDSITYTIETIRESIVE